VGSPGVTSSAIAFFLFNAFRAQAIISILRIMLRPRRISASTSARRAIRRAV
jgi:hypothetical protein